jgi:heat shock protein HslJ
MDMRISTFVVALSLIAGGGALAADLQNTKWVINDLGGHRAFEDPRTTIQFTNDGHAGGHAGCNDWNAPWHGSGAKLSFGPVATTRMACAGPVDDWEREFVAALTAVKAFRIEPSGSLILSDKHNKTVIRASQM